MDQKTESSPYENLLEKIFFAMGKEGKDKAIAKFGKGAENLYHTWEAYHFIDFVEEMFEVNHEVQFNDFLYLLRELNIKSYRDEFRKLPAAKGFTEIRAKKLFKGIEEIRRVRNPRFSERYLLLEFLLFCQKPYLTKDGSEKLRVMSIFYGEKSTSSTPIKQNDPVLIKKAQERLDEEIENLKEFCANSQSATQENWEQTKHTSQVVTARENSNVPFDPIESVHDSRHEIILVRGKDKQFNPYNLNELPLIGRKTEIDLLDEFIQVDGKFKIWAIAGPSGAGKTRLAIEWASKLENWTKWVLHKDDRTELDYWNSWSPDNPTLIIIDYMYGFEKLIRILMRNRSKKNIPNIRLLVIDHVFSEDLLRDQRWGLADDSRGYDQNEKFFFKKEPLDLTRKRNRGLKTETPDSKQTPDPDQEKIIKEIIAHLAKINAENDQVKEAHDYLWNMQGAYYPLFAALVGDAIKSGKYFKEWNRRQLIDYHLSGSDRLPWEYRDANTDELSIPGRWASYFIAVATARREMSYRDLINAAANCISFSKDRPPEVYDEVKEICQRVVTDSNTKILKPFEPDILGESFFLKFLQFIENSPEYRKEFLQIFIAGDTEKHAKDAIEFIAFIQRLTRNLLNDNQKDVEALWDVLFEFLNPSEFKSSEFLRWAMNVALIEIISAIKDKFPEEVNKLLNKIESGVLKSITNDEFLDEALIYSMGHFELESKYSAIIPKLEEMEELFDRFVTKKAENERETPLIVASFYGFNKIIDALLKDQRISIQTTFGNNHNALMAASMMGHNDTISLLLDKGAEIDAADNYGSTALIRSSKEGYIEIVSFLLEKKAKIDIADIYNYTSLIWASSNGHTETVKLLLDKGAEINAVEKEGQTALIMAINKGHIDTVQILLDREANTETQDKSGATALIRASVLGNIKIISLLLDRVKNESLGNNGEAALKSASAYGHIEVVKLLLDHGVEINAGVNTDYTALIWASLEGKIDVVKLLLENGADVNAIGKKGITALIWACSKGHLETAGLLIEKKANIHALDKVSRTALIWACSKGHHEIVRLLFENGADVDVFDEEGRTAFMHASGNGHLETMKLLISIHAKIHNADINGSTALMYASGNNQVEAARLLLDMNAEINAIDLEEWSALFWACNKNSIEVVKLLLERKARIDLVDYEGQTPLSIAQAKGNKEIVRLLVKHDVQN